MVNCEENINYRVGGLGQNVSGRRHSAPKVVGATQLEDCSFNMLSKLWHGWVVNASVCVSNLRIFH